MTVLGPTSLPAAGSNRKKVQKPAAASIDRVEPPSWWVGMKTPLQLMIHGRNLSGAEVTLSEPAEGVEVKAVHSAESANYLFVDLSVSETAKPQELKFNVKCGEGQPLKFSYQLQARRNGSAERQSYSSADLIYLLMPDRFANGDPSNDSIPGCAEAARRALAISRHGGDIKGIMDHLDYIQSLGVTCIWPTPLLFDNDAHGSYHGYACSDYYMIDPRFGSNDLYRQMVALSHEKGMKFIMDMVPNHCSTSHWWMKDLPFSDWINQFPTFTRSNFAIPTESDPHASKYDSELNSRGWFDRSMADMNLCNAYTLQYFKQWAVWWIEYADLDGLRVDTFPYSDKYAISDWVASIRNEYPNINIVGECWVDYPSTVAYWEGAHVNSDGYTSHLPSVMDFPMCFAIIPALNDNEAHPAWGEGMQKVYNVAAQDFVYNDPRTLLLFAVNHDTRRLSYQLGSDPQRVKMAMALMATLRGTPQLYVGDEQLFEPIDGQTGDPHDRIDFPGGWEGDRQNLFTGKNRTKAQQDVLDFTTAVFNYRKHSPALQSGDMLHYRPTDSNLYVYVRRLQGSPSVLTIVNNANYPCTIKDWNHYSEALGNAKKARDIVAGNTFPLTDSLKVPSKTAVILELQ
jgi:glycosidase